MGASKEITEIFYLTGGTALAAFYLHHRLSEDLDFFSEQDINPLSIQVFFKKHKAELGFTAIEFQRSFNRNLFFLHFPKETLKTEFTYFPFPRIEKGMRDNALQIDSLRDIAVNKIFTIYQRPRARDFIDLFFILKKKRWDFDDLLKEARLKFDTVLDPIQLGTQLLKVEELKDMPVMRVPLGAGKLKQFFLQKAKSLKGKIFLK